MIWYVNACFLRVNWYWGHLDGLVQERNSIANALELGLSCTNPLFCFSNFSASNKCDESWDKPKFVDPNMFLPFRSLLEDNSTEAGNIKLGEGDELKNT